VGHEWWIGSCIKGLRELVGDIENLDYNTKNLEIMNKKRWWVSNNKVKGEHLNYLCSVKLFS